MREPTLSDVHADLVGRFKHDERLRDVEQRTARVEAVIADLPRMENRLTTEIRESRRNFSQWAGVAVAAVAVFVAVIAVIQG